VPPLHPSPPLAGLCDYTCGFCSVPPRPPPPPPPPPLTDEEECKLHIGVSGFEEGDFKLFLYNYTQDAANAVAGGDMMDYDDFVATSCSPGCDDLRLGNAECDIACNTTECVWDGGDCGYDGGYGFEDNCATACPVAWIGDGYCDEACYNSACQWDGTDCTADSGCADGCMPNWIDDDECDEQCNNEACGWDGHDCSHEADECYTDSRGIDYRGHVAVSAAGHQCQVWSHQTPNAHTKTVLAFPTFGLGGHNFCRNPGSAEIGPWCYTIHTREEDLSLSLPPHSNKSPHSLLSLKSLCGGGVRACRPPIPPSLKVLSYEHTSEGGRDDRGVPSHAESTLSTYWS